MSQDQFLEVIDRDEAQRRFHAALALGPVGVETVPLGEALGRVLAEDVAAAVNVPSFDRSNYDGYAVRAADTFGAHEEGPRRLRLLGQALATGVVPWEEVTPGTAIAIATGGMLPRGADAVVMVEHTESSRHTPCAVRSDSSTAAKDESADATRSVAATTEADATRSVAATWDAHVLVRRAVTPGYGIAFTGTDITAGETVLRRGTVFTSRDTGVLAAVGAHEVTVWRRPRVGVLSTGDEILAPGEPMRPGMVYDSNARIVADAVRELGGEPILLGIVRDDLDQLRDRLRQALEQADVVILSGGTSKGAGDLSYRAVRELSEPGIVVHGVALKPGKPICLAAHRGKPVVILPGFPTSAIFTFHEFVAPVLLALGGRSARQAPSVEARLAVKINSEIGRTEFLLVNLVPGDGHLAAYPLGGGSGSVTTFSRADGFVTIGRHTEIVEAGSPVAVRLLGSELRVADLVVIGSHCLGLDFLLGRIQDQGFQVKFMAVGSTAGLDAARRGECDLAGIHLLDPATGRYNRPFLTPGLDLIEGYGRLQGVLYRPGDPRFEGLSAHEAIRRAAHDPSCVMVNRNRGSGTRILLDRLLEGVQPQGYAVEPRSHHAVAAAVAQGRADWGLAIETVARQAGLGFLPLEEERYDFAVPVARLNRPAVLAFQQLLHQAEIRGELAKRGFRIEPTAMSFPSPNRP